MDEKETDPADIEGTDEWRMKIRKGPTIMLMEKGLWDDLWKAHNEFAKTSQALEEKTDEDGVVTIITTTEFRAAMARRRDVEDEAAPLVHEYIKEHYNMFTLGDLPDWFMTNLTEPYRDNDISRYGEVEYEKS